MKHGRPPVRLILGAVASPAWMDVVDAGEGMAPELVDRLQEAFTRGDISGSTSGSALGLAIVRHVAARPGGELSFKHGNGTQRGRETLTGAGRLHE